MKYRVLNWLLMVLAAALLNLTLRYWFGDFQGYLTFPVGGTDYGFAHIKSSTVWVSGREFTHIPGILVFGALLAVLTWLMYEVRLVWRGSLHKP
jgi:hypothetical protein